MHYDSRTKYQNSSPIYGKHERVIRQGQPFIKTISSCTNTLNQRLDKVTRQVKQQQTEEIKKEANDLKLSLHASVNIYKDKQQIHHHL